MDLKDAEAMAIMMNTAMHIERSRFLKAEPYERTGQRQGYANGYKAKTVRTRIGEIQLAVPQTKSSDFYPRSLERGLRSERALKLALAEMYVQGVSTRKVARITEELCGFEVSFSEVSRASEALDNQYLSFHYFCRRINECCSLFAMVCFGFIYMQKTACLLTIRYIFINISIVVYRIFNDYYL